MLIVQTPEGLQNADSYVSVNEFNEYLQKRGIVLINDTEQLLIKAMDYIDANTYLGNAENVSQSTSFPRKSYGIPNAVKSAQMALAVIADTTDLQPNLMPGMGNVVGEKVGDIEVRYEISKATLAKPYFPLPDNLLAPYLYIETEENFSINFGVYRG